MIKERIPSSHAYQLVYVMTSLLVEKVIPSTVRMLTKQDTGFEVRVWRFSFQSYNR
jgi:hypothetical protein